MSLGRKKEMTVRWYKPMPLGWHGTAPFRDASRFSWSRLECLHSHCEEICNPAMCMFMYKRSLLVLDTINTVLTPFGNRGRGKKMGQKIMGITGACSDFP